MAEDSTIRLDKLCLGFFTLCPFFILRKEEVPTLDAERSGEETGECKKARRWNSKSHITGGIGNKARNRKPFASRGAVSFA